ncbi:MAG: SDR family oxidoreductase [Microbacterium sp.]
MSAGQDAARRRALVTGSTSGIGRATAIRLAASGHDVTINYSRDAARADEVLAELHEHGGTHRAVRADVSAEADVRELVAAAAGPDGRLDALVNNAGTTMSTPQADLDGIDLDEWDRVMAVNVRSVVQVTRAAAPALRAAGGSIVNIASIVGLRPTTQPLVYPASKAAVVSLTRTLSRALAPEIRVNAVAPGWTAGGWMERTLGADYGERMAERATVTPLRRNGTFEDVAASVEALLTMHPFVTGEVIVVDGGFSATT